MSTTPPESPFRGAILSPPGHACVFCGPGYDCREADELADDGQPSRDEL